MMVRAWLGARVGVDGRVGVQVAGVRAGRASAVQAARLACPAGSPSHPPTAGSPPARLPEHTDPGSGLVTRQELARLQGILAGLPTTEAEDAALLGGGSMADWRQRAILQFRVQRKRALRLTIQRLQAALERQPAGEAGACGAATAADGGGAAACGAPAAVLEAEAAAGASGVLEAAAHTEL